MRSAERHRRARRRAGCTAAGSAAVIQVPKARVNGASTPRDRPSAAVPARTSNSSSVGDDIRRDTMNRGIDVGNHEALDLTARARQNGARSPPDPMTTEEIAARVRDEIARITGVPATTIGDHASFQQDLGLDSLSLLELVVHLEYGFKINVPEHDQAALRTVADTARYVHDRLAAGA